MKLICDESSLLTARIRLFRLKPTGGSEFNNLSCTPGEYFSFHFRDENNCSFQRCYTLVSMEQGKYYDFIIEDKGTGSASSVISQLLADRKEIEIAARGGNITFDSIREKNNVLFVAGGIGITLPLALIRECFRVYGYSAPGKHFMLMLSCNDLGSVPCLNELLDLHSRCDWFSLRINVTRAVLDITCDVIRIGRIDLTTVEINIPPETAVICGSVGFAETMVLAIRQRFPQAAVAVEAFSSMPVTAVRTTGLDILGGSLTVKNLNREIPADTSKTILDNLTQHDIPVRNMCRAGICGSCKFRLDRGSVRSEPDFCLSAKDKADNIHLACCSFPDKNVVIEII
ncbi:2Fe-2S iron-sulfur cluster-binding protein [Yersinia enterocolitica]|uniref:2Fe-2S iron-sulfur cluster-binding protein n=1 Tax=Yersinia enterocolitica TaxID=630 RepID=UPI00330ABD5F|nr:2Fe-2S iron-sulfur cluster binding domain-containing protein [Yersinia enterocolitica]HDM8436879.1 2Fe-2S iron-sulfur cluster binding domain-containing protein [Yersinia enterocolitica]